MNGMCWGRNWLTDEEKEDIWYNMIFDPYIKDKWSAYAW